MKAHNSHHGGSIAIQALSVRQPWAHAILHLGKDIENRTWWTPYRGTLIIHAGKAYDRDGAEHLARTVGGPSLARLIAQPRGAILGVVELIDVLDEGRTDSPWAEPRGDRERVYHWVLRNPRPLSELIPARGYQSLWIPAPEILGEIRRQLGGTA